MNKNSTASIVESIVQALRLITVCNGYETNAGYNTHIHKQDFGIGDVCKYPGLSVFGLEETLEEHKGNCYKQSLNLTIEGYMIHKYINESYALASDIKRALLSNSFPFQIFYQGYELFLPEESSRLSRIQMRFKLIYVEHIY